MNRTMTVWKDRELCEMTHDELCEIVVELHRENNRLRKEIRDEWIRRFEEKLNHKSWFQRIIGR
jgi:hypothetical protein